MTESIPARVTMVVAMRNEAASIEACLASLAAQDHPADRLEVLVYDGGSTDGSRALAEAFAAGRPGWAVLPNPRRIQAAAWNAGTRIATGDYVGIVSGHAELEPTYVTHAVRAIEATGADMVGGPVHAIGVGPIGEAVAIAISSPFGVGGARHHYLTERDEVDTVFMGFCRRETYLRFPFDEQMVRNQDDELSYRLRDAGGRIVCDPAIRSRYRSRSSLIGLWRQYFDYGRWKVRVLQAHPRQARLRHFVPLGLVVALAAGSLAGLVLPVARVGTAAVALAYAAATLAASVRYGAGRGLAVKAALIVVYPTLHLAFGTGMIAGAIRFLVLDRTPGRSAGGPGSVEPSETSALVPSTVGGERESAANEIG